jgi:queuosine precursor transporter
MIIAIIVYAFSMTLANLLIAKFGVWMSPINSFLLIGLTLVLRDWLHIKLKAWQMGLLIIFSGLITYVLNPAAAQIAIASSIAFTVAAIADWIVFAKLNGSWFKRSNSSNVVGSAVDSVAFPTIAFGALMPEIVLAQFASKIFGGFIWSILLNKKMTETSK